MDADRLFELLAPVEALSAEDRAAVASHLTRWERSDLVPAARKQAYYALATLVRELPQRGA